MSEDGTWKMFEGDNLEEGLKQAKDALTPIELAQDQKKFIIEHWDKMDLLTLTRETFQNPKLDGRSKEARAIKIFLGGKKPKTTKHVPVEAVILSDSQKEYIRNMIGNLTPFEIGKILFDNPKLEPLSKQMVAINEYVKQLDEGVEQFPHEEYAVGEYKPPTQLSAVVGKVNKYLRKDLDLRSMPTGQKKNIEILRGFLQAPRFIETINSYISAKSRDLFEGEFVRTTFDKPDLIPDEVNIAITLCQHYVMSTTLHRHLDLLNAKYEEVMNDPDGKMTTTLADMIKSKSDELDKSEKTRERLVKLLSGERSKRQDKQTGNVASFARFLEAWREEEERLKMLKMAKLQEEQDKVEIDRLETFGEMKARILGVSKSEMLYG